MQATAQINYKNSFEALTWVLLELALHFVSNQLLSIRNERHHQPIATNNKLVSMDIATEAIRSVLASCIHTCQCSPEKVHVWVFDVDMVVASAKSTNKRPKGLWMWDLVRCICPSYYIRAQFSRAHFSYSLNWESFAWIEPNWAMAKAAYPKLVR